MWKKRTDSVFHQRLSAICRERGLAVVKYINGFGISSGTLSGWKNGVYPGSDIVYTVARDLDTTSDYLIGLSDNPTRTGIELNSIEIELIEAFRAADPALQSAALAVLKTATPKIPEKAAKLSASQNADLRDAL